MDNVSTIQQWRAFSIDEQASDLGHSFHLVRHPDKLKRLREEIMAAAGVETLITRAHTRNMPYLTAVLNESELPQPCPAYHRYISDHNDSDRRW